MLKAYAYIFSQWAGDLAALEATLRARRAADGDAAPVGGAQLDIATTHRWLEQLREVAATTDLDAVIAQVVRMRTELSPDTPILDALVMVADLRRRIMDQLAGRRFYYVAPAYEGYYGDAAPLWNDVWASFPSTVDDTIEAGRCLALGRGTACVFHLMRVMEAGLRTLSKELGIPYAPSWEAHLKQINDRVSAKHRTKGVRWKRDEAFFKDIAGDLQLIKMAWRNPTMHIAKHYGPEQAGEVFAAVRRFMEHLATRVAEPNSYNATGRDAAEGDGAVGSG